MSAVLLGVRWLVFGSVALLAAGALAGMAVQRRLLNPFGRPARAIRDMTDPLLKPIERRLLRGGGNPQNAPWWLMAIAIIGGILVITAVDWITGQVLTLIHAASSGGRGLLWLVIDWSFSLLIFALLVRVIGSWFGIGPYNRWMRPFHTLTEWFLRPLRQFIPPFGPMDITPLVAWLLLIVLRSALLGIL